MKSPLYYLAQVHSAMAPSSGSQEAKCFPDSSASHHWHLMHRIVSTLNLMEALKNLL